MKKRWKASATVEAAFIVPIVIYIVLTLILVMFLIHDRVVLQSAVCEISVVGGNYYTEKEGKTAAEQVKDQITTKRLFGSKNLRGDCKVKQKEATASYQAAFLFPDYAASYVLAKQANINVSWKHKRVQATSWLRKYRGLSHTVEKLYEKIKSWKTTTNK